MANKFLKALAAVNLVELEGDEPEKVAATGDVLDMDEIDRILAEEAKAEADAKARQAKTGGPPKRRAAPRQPETAPTDFQAPKTSPAAGPPASSEGIREGVPFEALYQEAGIAEAPYSAEKLLRVLEGLKAMPASTRKAAVLAMDAADDEWSIADAVLDANRKIRTLESTSGDLQGELAAIREEAASDKEKRDLYLEEATKKVRAEIDELEQKLAQEVATMTAQKADIDAKVKQAEEACAREVARLTSESVRLKEVPETFAEAARGPQVPS